MIHTLEHGGMSYAFDPNGTADAECEYIDDRANPKRRYQVDYKFELKGAHDGDVIEVWALNIHEESDDDGGRVPAWSAKSASLSCSTRTRWKA